VKLVVSDADEGLRNALAHAGKARRRIVSAWIGIAYAQEDAAAAHIQWRTVADQLRPKVPKLAALTDAADEDVLACMRFPAAHRTELHSTNPIERLNGEIKRRTDLVGIVPNEAAVARLVGGILLERSDAWATQRSRYMILETIGALSNTTPVSLSACQPVSLSA
jgi:transposase-like protein